MKKSSFIALVMGTVSGALFLGINLIRGERIDMAKSKIVKATEQIADAVTVGYKKVAGRLTPCHFWMCSGNIF